MAWAGNIPQNRIDKRTRRLAQQLNRYDLTLGTFLVPYTGAQNDVDLGSHTFTTTGTAATGDLTVSSTLILASGSMTDTSGSISFGNENLSTSGSISCTRGASDTNQAFGLTTMTAAVTGTSNTAVGNLALEDVTSGSNNTCVGYGAGKNITTQSYNVCIGKDAGGTITTGYWNIAIGRCLYTNVVTGYGNVALGHGAMAKVNSGNNNFALGFTSLENLTSGSGNVGIGEASLRLLTTNSNNTGIGTQALYNCLGTANTVIGGGGAGYTLGNVNYNTVVGFKALYTANTSNNVAIGTNAGRAAIGAANIFIGYGAGYNEAGSNKLYIANSDTTTPLILGDFSTPALAVNGLFNVSASGKYADYDVNFYGSAYDVHEMKLHWDANTGTTWFGSSNNIIGGYFNLSIGHGNTVASNYNVVSGLSNNVNGTYNAVFGRQHPVTSSYALVGGYINTINDQYAFAAGRNNTVHYGCGAIGRGNTASGNYSFSVGYLNSSTGIEAMSFGLSNTAGHSVAIMIGNGNSSTGNYAYCIGNGNSAGFNGLSLGYYNVSSGNYSISIGRENTSSGVTSIAIGKSVIASADAATAIGLGFTNNTINSVKIGITNSLFFGTLTSIRLNDDGVDIDVVIEGDTDVNLLHTDASTDRVGIGIAAPTDKLHVNGGLTLDGVSSSLYIDGSIITSSTGTISFTSDNLITTGLGTFGSIVITAPNTTNYLFTTRGTSDTLALQSQTAGTKCVLELFTKNGGGSDEVTFRLFAQGTPESIANFEDLDVRYDPGGPYYIIRSSAAGIGTIHPIRLNCGVYLSQLVLNSNGNVGINTATPDSQFEVNGESRFGASGTNYAQFATDGELTLAGTARVNKHVRVSAAAIALGASAPTRGYVGTFPTLDFDALHDDNCNYSLIVPFAKANNTTVKVVVDWCYTGANDTGTVRWELDYLCVADGETVAGGVTTISKTTAGNHTSGNLIRTTLDTGITGCVAHDIMGLELTRVASVDTMAADAHLVQVHFEYIMDKLGQAT